MSGINFAALMEPVARHLLGEPNRHLSSKEQLRFGTNGSLSVEIAGDKAGTFYDHERDVGGGLLDFIAHKTGAVNGSGMAWLTEHGFIPHNDTRPTAKRIVATYDYHTDNGSNPDGRLVFQVVRQHPKAFRQRRPDGKGGWIWNLKGVAPVLYRLPELLKADPARVVFIPEGEKDVDRLRSLGFVATCNPGGAGKWSWAYKLTLRGRRVVVLPDNDEAGENHATQIVASLRGHAASVAVLHLPDLGPKGDVSEWLDAGGTKEDLEALVSEAAAAREDAKHQDAQGSPEKQVDDDRPDGAKGEQRQSQDKAGDNHDTPGDARPEIRIEGGNIVQEVDAAEAALIAAKSGIYQRGVLLARTGVVSIEISDDRTALGLHVLPVDEHALLEAMTRAARWTKYDGRSKDWREVNAPLLAVRVFLGRAGHWNLPTLTGIISAPTLRRDGSVLATPGYDAATGLLFDPCGQSFPPMPDKPTKQQAIDALAALKNLVRDFPFGGVPNNPEPCADRSVALSAFLTAAVRRTLPTAPLHGFTAPAAGTGKSILADIASVIVTGREAGVIAQGSKPEEFEKRLGSMFLASEPVIAIDNCEQPLGIEYLCQALTQRRIRVRILGASKMPEVLANSLITATGNNLTLTGDMNRRALLCSLDAKMERPETRKFDADPVEEAKRRRPELVASALTVLRAYAVAGRPKQSDIPLGSFTEWSRWVRDALIWLGEADPVTTMETTRKTDPVLEALTEVMTEWRRAFGNTPTLVKDVVAKANQTASEPYSGKTTPANPGLRDVLLVVAGRGGAINNQALGMWLGKQRNRVANKRRFIKGSETDGAPKWELVDA